MVGLVNHQLTASTSQFWSCSASPATREHSQFRSLTQRRRSAPKHRHCLVPLPIMYFIASGHAYRRGLNKGPAGFAFHGGASKKEIELEHSLECTSSHTVASLAARVVRGDVLASAEMSPTRNDAHHRDSFPNSSKYMSLWIKTMLLAGALSVY